MESSFPIDWGELSEVGFSVGFTTERDVKWLWRVTQSSGRHEYDAGRDETIHDTII